LDNKALNRLFNEGATLLLDRRCNTVT